MTPLELMTQVIVFAAASHAWAEHSDTPRADLINAIIR